MSERPYILLSCCVSLDGYLDDCSDAPLQLSNEGDLERVDAVRADCDAILIGAGTVRKDDPRLVVRSATLRSARIAAGRTGSPMKVVVTRSGDLSPERRFFTVGDADRVVYAATPAVEDLRRRLAGLATVADGGPRPSMGAVLDDLATRGVRRLLVEGGTDLLTQLLTAGLADELHLAVAPVFVGDDRAARFVHGGRFPWTTERRAALLGTSSVGDVAVLRFALSERCPMRVGEARP